MEKKKPAPDGAGVREGVRKMDNQKILETLEKQLQLLSERSAGCMDDLALAKISASMLGISRFLMSQRPGRGPYLPLK